jgi:hypothetical protein
MNQEIKVHINPDENGFIGRECPECKMYFKVKPGTGLPITYHICPYCNHQGPNDTFFTEDQIKYAESVAMKKIIDPFLEKINKSFKTLENATKNGFIQFKVTTTGTPIQIKKYQEKILETDVTCNNCSLIFSIYGVFSNCPDCGKLNVKAIFDKSIEVSKKMLTLSEQNEDINVKEELLKNALLGAISSFDSLGKELRNRHPTKFPSKPKNLFQNFIELDKTLKKSFNKNIKDYLSPEDSDFLLKMFQVRHIYEHYKGVIDDDFVKVLPEFVQQKGRKYKLEKQEIESFLNKMEVLTQKIYSESE